MPGANARAMEKARDLPADALIFDLEDAVAPAEKETARRQVIETLQKGGYGNRELVVRVNGLMTPWGEADVAEMATAGAHALLIPKVENKQIINGVEGRMLTAQAPDAMSIWCMIETPKGVMRAEEIASASPRLGALVMGTSDLAKDLHCLHTPSRGPFMTSLSWCILAARANGLSILDGVHLEQDKTTLVIVRPGGTANQLPISADWQDWWGQQQYKNRVIFLTGSRDTYQKVLDSARQARARQSGVAFRSRGIRPTRPCSRR